MPILETVRQAAQRIPSARSKHKHIDVNVVRRWIHSGKLTRHYRAGQVMVDRDEINLLIGLRDREPVALVEVDERWQRALVQRAIEEILS